MEEKGAFLKGILRFSCFVASFKKRDTLRFADYNYGINLVTGVRNNMKNKLMTIYDRVLLRKRSVIETINDKLKNVAQLVHSRHRSILNLQRSSLYHYYPIASLRRSQ